MPIEARMFRESWRNLRRTPAVSLAALLTLAIGLGISFAIFNAVYASLWQPPPASLPAWTRPRRCDMNERRYGKGPHRLSSATRSCMPA